MFYISTSSFKSEHPTITTLCRHPRYTVLEAAGSVARDSAEGLGLLKGRTNGRGNLPRKKLLVASSGPLPRFSISVRFPLIIFAKESTSVAIARHSSASNWKAAWSVAPEKNSRAPAPEVMGAVELSSKPSSRKRQVIVADFSTNPSPTLRNRLKKSKRFGINLQKH